MLRLSGLMKFSASVRRQRYEVPANNNDKSSETILISMIAGINNKRFGVKLSLLVGERLALYTSKFGAQHVRD